MTGGPQACTCLGYYCWYVDKVFDKGCATWATRSIESTVHQHPILAADHERAERSVSYLFKATVGLALARTGTVPRYLAPANADLI